MKNWFLGFMVVLLVTVGCSKDRVVECPKIAPYLTTYGYDSSQIDSILITQYEKGLNLSKIKDQRYLITAPHLPDDENSYSISVGDWNEYYNSYEDYDWKYTILFDSASIVITEAKRKLNKTNYDHPTSGCFSYIIEAKLDGIRIVNNDGIRYFSFTKP